MINCYWSKVKRWYKLGDKPTLLMFKYRESSSIYGTKWDINDGGSLSTGGADKPKALPYWLRINLENLVELYIKVSIIV